MSEFSILISIKKKETECQRSLEWLKNNSKVKADGWMQTDGSIDSMAALQVIYSSVNIEPSIPDGTKKHTILSALNRWRQEEKLFNAPNLIGAFKQALQTELDQLEAKKTGFTILMFLNLDQQSVEDLSPILIQGKELRLSGWDDLSQLKTDEFWKELEFFHSQGAPLLNKIYSKNKTYYLRDRTNFIPVIAEVQAYNTYTAASIANEHFELFRAALNLPPAWRILSRSSGTPSPLSKFLPSPIFGVFNQNGDYIQNSIYQTTERYKYRKERFEQADIPQFMVLVKKFERAEPEQLAELIVKLVRLYQQATDFINPYATFLTFWQFLEILTLTQPGEGGTQVEKRITTFLGLQGEEMLKQALGVIAESRHTLVHTGIFPNYAEELVFTLKGIVDLSLMRLIGLSKHLSTIDELRAYFRYVSNNDANLERAKETVESEIKRLEAAKKVIGLVQDARMEKN